MTLKQRWTVWDVLWIRCCKRFPFFGTLKARERAAQSLQLFSRPQSHLHQRFAHGPQPVDGVQSHGPRVT